MIGGKSFIVDDEGNEEELPPSGTPDLTKQDSQQSMAVSSESGFNEDEEDSKSEQTEDSAKTQLLFTRGEDLKSFTDRCTLESTVQKILWNFTIIDKEMCPIHNNVYLI